MMKNVLAIVGSASSASANLKLVEKIKTLAEGKLSITVFNSLKLLPSFDPDLSVDNPPQLIKDFRLAVEKADGVIICSPEYVFSIPSGLKNAIEWCISTTVFSNKPVGIITASASGIKAHEELQLIMQTAMATLSNETSLLIQGIKGKFDADGDLQDELTLKKLKKFIDDFVGLLALK
ncbi:NADPH-dependent FMN reductase [Pedobacter arcticus]|uniref:NADPH-dependent FMN reductase n=1 Tax=Pedobacter arcticus TaxID=752140 RepID=UPI000688EA94|nr:NADPH-dependent FMN reductase [Pedobacter arcticus]